MADFESLRRQAEALLKENNNRSIPEDTDLFKLIYELEVYQIELKLQTKSSKGRARSLPSRATSTRNCTIRPRQDS
jgi:hypothetical protein